MIILGLTGSIGMGKSTTARMFEEASVPLHDSDETVHRLYTGAAAPLIEKEFPGTVENGVVDRKKLSAFVLRDAVALRRLESIIHPLVRADERTFLENYQRAGATLVVLDIPLLFEVGATDRVDKVLVVTTSPDVQKRRVLGRPGMSEAKFRSILEKQVPDAEKRKRADFIIDTGLGMKAARESVGRIIAELTANPPLSTNDGT